MTVQTSKYQVAPTPKQTASESVESEAVFPTHALRVLTTALRAAFRDLAADESNDPDIAIQARYAVALLHIAKFLKHAEVGDDIAARFAELGSAIYGLHHGAIAGPVRPQTFGKGRAPDGHAVWQLRAKTVFGLNLILKSGRMTKQRAAAHVANAYPQLHRLKRNPGDDLRIALLSWRTACSAGKVPETIRAVVQEQKQHVAAFGDVMAPSTLFQRAEVLLAAVARDADQAAI